MQRGIASVENDLVSVFQKSVTEAHTTHHALTVQEMYDLSRWAKPLSPEHTPVFLFYFLINLFIHFILVFLKYLFVFPSVELFLILHAVNASGCSCDKAARLCPWGVGIKTEAPQGQNSYSFRKGRDTPPGAEVLSFTDKGGDFLLPELDSQTIPPRGVYSHCLTHIGAILCPYIDCIHLEFA